MRSHVISMIMRSKISDEKWYFCADIYLQQYDFMKAKYNIFITINYIVHCVELELGIFVFQWNVICSLQRHSQPHHDSLYVNCFISFFFLLLAISFINQLLCYSCYCFARFYVLFFFSLIAISYSQIVDEYFWIYHIPSIHVNSKCCFVFISSLILKQFINKVVVFNYHYYIRWWQL